MALIPPAREISEFCSPCVRQSVAWDCAGAAWRAGGLVRAVGMLVGASALLHQPSSCTGAVSARRGRGVMRGARTRVGLHRE